MSFQRLVLVMPSSVLEGSSANGALPQPKSEIAPALLLEVCRPSAKKIQSLCKKQP